MVTRTRKITSENKGTIDFDGLTLKNAHEYIQSLIVEYGEGATLEWEYPSYEGEVGRLYLSKERFETDEEMAARILLEEQHEQDREARDRKEFERLQAKFGAGNEQS